MSRLEHITSVGYQVKFQWEYEFDDAGIDTRTARPRSNVPESPMYPARSVRWPYRDHAPTL
jgi:hypothetical protein